MNNRNIVISEGGRPWWQLILAALCFTGMIVCLYLYFKNIDTSASTMEMESITNFIYIAIVLMITGLNFSLIRDMHFDFGNARYKIERRLGNLKFGKWKELKNLAYVSVFKQPLRDGNYVYEVNLWHSRNKHFNIYRFDGQKDALISGKDLSKSLQIDLLDATVPNDYKWVELD